MTRCGASSAQASRRRSPAVAIGPAALQTAAKRAFGPTEARASVDNAMEQIRLLLVLAAANPGQHPYHALRLCADAIHSVGGASGLTPIGAAADGLGAFIDGLQTAGDWDAEGLQLHHDAMCRLRNVDRLPPQAFASVNAI